MTIEEIIRGYPALEDVKAGAMYKALADRDLDGTASYASSYQEKTELVAADLMVLMATFPEFSEGDLSIKYNPAILKEMAKKIYDKYDDPKAATVFNQPTISSKTNLW